MEQAIMKNISILLFLTACGPQENLEDACDGGTDSGEVSGVQACIEPEDLGSYEERCEEMCMEHVYPAVMGYVDGSVEMSCTEVAAGEAYRACYNGCILEIAMDIQAVKDLCGE